MAALRLIVFDLDGTLLGADHRLTPYTVSVLDRAAAVEGLTLMAASGRSHWAAEMVLAETDAIDHVICSNGAALYRRSTREMVQRRQIPLHDMADLYAQVHGAFPDACWAWETEQGIVPDDRFRVVGRNLDELAASPPLTLPGDPSDPIADRLEGFGPIVRGLLSHPRISPADVRVELERRKVPALVSSSSAIFLEVTQSGVHKGAMLERFCAAERIPAAQVVAFGDHLNDLSMLQWAGRGIAMKGAYPEVVAQVPHVTDHPFDHDGAALALEKLIADL